MEPIGINRYKSEDLILLVSSKMYKKISLTVGWCVAPDNIDIIFQFSYLEKF